MNWLGEFLFCLAVLLLSTGIGVAGYVLLQILLSMGGAQ